MADARCFHAPPTIKPVPKQCRLQHWGRFMRVHSSALHPNDSVPSGRLVNQCSRFWISLLHQNLPPASLFSSRPVRAGRSRVKEGDSHSSFKSETALGLFGRNCNDNHQACDSDLTINLDSSQSLQSRDSGPLYFYLQCTSPSMVGTRVYWHIEPVAYAGTGTLQAKHRAPDQGLRPVMRLSRTGLQIQLVCLQGETDPGHVQNCWH